MRDLSKERQSRLEAERRLKEALLESETCKSRLESLQEDFAKMQDTMNAVMEYQNNLEQLKQEKNCLVQKYEVTIATNKASRQTFFFLSGIARAFPAGQAAKSNLGRK